MKYCLAACFAVCSMVALAQETQNVEDLKKEILQLREDVDLIQMNLAEGETKFKRGIVVATIGYCVTIAGGLMLGRSQDDLGKVLLVSGGATGITGTVMMVDAFKYLGRAGKSSQRH
ncbi:MAG: hypothetical protein OEV74_14920 [Cyclobacteriaceae bacterium]|jgi:hypothetical protein|nr:hypothetical protein [Cyclobacteriaceae bacterium]MDH4297572.1 hypothetical protein [Cyclobacteriaceae bacterium]MDH5249683.1 hypothetical protein [Cyclobacteriaceae bacterium]